MTFFNTRHLLTNKGSRELTTLCGRSEQMVLNKAWLVHQRVSEISASEWKNRKRKWMMRYCHLVAFFTKHTWVIPVPLRERHNRYWLVIFLLFCININLCDDPFDQEFLTRHVLWFNERVMVAMVALWMGSPLFCCNFSDPAHPLFWDAFQLNAAVKSTKLLP